MKKRKQVLNRTFAALFSAAVVLPALNVQAMESDAQPETTVPEIMAEGEVNAYSLAPTEEYDATVIAGVDVTVKCENPAEDGSICAAIYDGEYAKAAVEYGKSWEDLSTLLNVNPEDAAEGKFDVMDLSEGEDEFTLTYKSADLSEVTVLAAAGDFAVTEVKYVDEAGNEVTPLTADAEEAAEPEDNEAAGIDNGSADYEIATYAAEGADITGDEFGKDGSIYALAPSENADKITGVTVTVQCVKFFDHMGDNSCCVALYDGKKAIQATGTGAILNQVQAILGIVPTEGSGDTFTLSYDSSDLSNVAVVAASGDFKVVKVDYKYAEGADPNATGGTDNQSANGAAGSTGTNGTQTSNGTSTASGPKTGDVSESLIYGTLALMAAVAVRTAYKKKENI